MRCTLWCSVRVDCAGNDLQQFNRAPCLGLVIASQSLKAGHGLLVHGLAKFQCLSVKFASQGLTFPGDFLVLLVRSRHSLKFQAVKFQTLGLEIWRIRPPPCHTPRCACLDSMSKLGSIATQSCSTASMQETFMPYNSKPES